MRREDVWNKECTVQVYTILVTVVGEIQSFLLISEMSVCCWRIFLGRSDPLCDTCRLHRNLQVVGALTLHHTNSSAARSLAQMGEIRKHKETESSGWQINQLSVCQVHLERTLVHTRPLCFLCLCVCVFMCLHASFFYVWSWAELVCITSEWHCLCSVGSMNNFYGCWRWQRRWWPNLCNDCRVISECFFISMFLCGTGAGFFHEFYISRF